MKRRPTIAGREAKGGSAAWGARSGSRLRQVTAVWSRVLDTEALWVVLLLVVGSWTLAPRALFGPKLEVGAVASRDVLATTEILVPDEETTVEQRRRAREAVLPVYDFDPMAGATLDEQLARLFVEGRDVLSYGDSAAPNSGSGAPPTSSAETEGEDLQVALETASSLKIEASQAELFREQTFSAELEDRVRGLVASLMRAGVVDNKPQLLENRLEGVTLRNLQTGKERVQLDLYDYRGYPDEVESLFDSEIRRWRGWSATQRRTLLDFLLANITPNIYFNRTETASRREAAAESEQQVFRQIRKGQVIVRKGDVIDSAAVRVWNEMEGRRQSASTLLPILGNGLLLLLVALVLWLALVKEQRPREQVAPKLGSLLLLLVLALVATKFGAFLATVLSEAETSPIKSELIYAHAIPFAALALVTSLLFGRSTALVTATLFSVLAGRLFEGHSTWAMLYSLAGSFAAIYSLDKLKERSAVTRAGLVVGLANMATSVMLMSLYPIQGRTAADVGFDMVCSFAGGLLVAATASFVLPVLESLLSVTTDIKLIELSDTNLPLLRRLAFEAPGTFQHSMMVANLAKEGCEAIGSNPVLAYTGGLYHDIGKVFRPDYFVENQRGGENRHDKLSPSMSALIVISHVKDGLKLARDHRLPEPIRDAIEQHHGTRVLSYFFKRAQDQAGEEADEVPASDYRYPGPRPQSKVMGVLMYADAVEAASRTLIHPSPAKLGSVLRKILDDCLQDGQLDETDLTLEDLRKVTEAFRHVLENTYHRRVDYPGFDFNPEAQAKRLRVVDGGGAKS